MLKPKHQYAVYILTNKKKGTFYIGMTNNLERRIFEHKQKCIDGFTKKYNLDILVYFEVYQFVEDAIRREKRMKAWKRQWKINLIEEDNKDWNDLASDWYD
ncbi:GIY-YIG nuclease family protein [Aquimarina algiphila]|uniref:GIY-YIG nuclease family protein n=1 Tax=Aquimarina algiphila TaxID=2047982 RepID=UPI00232BC5F5|nr:GIY-YIG nuclease family protein [Aquimarina algiphila]